MGNPEGLVPRQLKLRIEQWSTLSRWERSELGRDLRRLGLSYGEIGRLIDVKKSTLATWCRDIVLTEAQARAITERTGSRAGIPVDTNWRRRQEIEQIRKRAAAEAETLTADPAWVAGVVLYWAEGSKTRNHLGVSNSDPVAHRLFIDWVRRFLNESAEFTLQLHLHEGNDEAAAKSYWRTALELPDAGFHRTFIKPKGTGHRKNHLPHGVCRVTVRRAADDWNRAMAWIAYLREALPLGDGR